MKISALLIALLAVGIAGRTQYQQRQVLGLMERQANINDTIIQRLGELADNWILSSANQLEMNQHLCGCRTRNTHVSAILSDPTQ